MRQILILVLCFVLYVVAVEISENHAAIARQGQLVKQEQSFNYVPPPPPTTEDGATVVTDAPDINN